MEKEQNDKDKRGRLAPGSQWEQEHDNQYTGTATGACGNRKADKRKKDILYSKAPINDRIEQIRKRVKSRFLSKEGQEADSENTQVFEIDDKTQKIDEESQEAIDREVQFFNIDDSTQREVVIHDMCQNENGTRPSGRAWIEDMQDKYNEWYRTNQSWEEFVSQGQRMQSSPEVQQLRW